jgi:histidine triad (HIT) family protein
MSTDCVFCRIVAGEIPAKVVHQTPDLIAIRDINPQAPIHILILPRQHLAGVEAVTAHDQNVLGALMLAAAHVAEQEGIAANGYRLVINSGADGGQTVPHLHVHVLGGRQMTWPPG